MRVPQSGSPVIDAGACTGQDQRGVSRPLGAACDLGAVEAAADLGVTLTGPASAAGGTDLGLIATVVNNGPDPVSATLSVSGTAGGGPLGTIEPGAQRPVVLTARAPAQISVTVQGDVPDPVASNGSASLTIVDSTAGGSTPGAACSVVKKGTPKSDRLRGTAAGDRMLGRKGNDRLKGLGGADCLNGGKGADRLIAGPGDDRVAARDGQRDVVRCGPGRDVVVADRRDRIAKNCETTRRR
jgi:Ca2+-binding RTX toxin-like protein